MDTSNLAKRMKDYETISKTRLMKRCPVICRIDGKAHHNFTRGFKRPFDEIYITIINSMLPIMVAPFTEGRMTESFWSELQALRYSPFCF